MALDNGEESHVESASPNISLPDNLEELVLSQFDALVSRKQLLWEPSIPEIFTEDEFQVRPIPRILDQEPVRTPNPQTKNPTSQPVRGPHPPHLIPETNRSAHNLHHPIQTERSLPPPSRLGNNPTIVAKTQSPSQQILCLQTYATGDYCSVPSSIT